MIGLLTGSQWTALAAAIVASGLLIYWAISRRPGRAGVEWVGFADVNNGFLVTQGSGKGLFRTINGGTTWTPQVIHTNNTLRFAWAAVLVPNLAVACGENGTLLKTIVGGN